MLRTVMLTLLCAVANFSLAQTIPLDQLSRLDARFQTITSVSSVQGQQITATVSYQRGDAFTLLAPRTVQQLDYLIANGAAVKKQQAIAKMGGPELHHFLLEYRSNRDLMRDAKRRFDSNKALYKKNAISARQWKEISEAYYQSYLEHEHMQHFYQLVLSEDEQLDQITIAAPINSRIEFSTTRQYVEEGAPIASFIPDEAIRLKASVPFKYQDSLSKLSVGSCQLKVDEISAVAEGFFVEAWTEPLNEHCPYLLGQTLLATPLLTIDAYQVPKSAVFRWSQRDAVFIRASDQLKLVYVELIGEHKGDYIVKSEQVQQDVQVLSSSISAVQGILLGLGDE